MLSKLKEENKLCRRRVPGTFIVLSCESYSHVLVQLQVYMVGVSTHHTLCLTTFFNPKILILTLIIWLSDPDHHPYLNQGHFGICRGGAEGQTVNSINTRWPALLLQLQLYSTLCTFLPTWFELFKGTVCHFYVVKWYKSLNTVKNIYMYIFYHFIFIVQIFPLFLK